MCFIILKCSLSIIFHFNIIKNVYHYEILKFLKFLEYTMYDI